MSEKKKQKDVMSLSELDDRLHASKDGSLKREILGKLQGYQRDLKSKMERGELSPEEFEAAKAFSKGLTQAHVVIENQK